MMSQQNTPDGLDGVPNVSRTESYEFEINLFEQRGKCCVSYNYTCGFRPQASQVALYEGDPANPTQHVAWMWADCVGHLQPGQVWNTGQDWGSGWSAALIAQNCDGRTWVFVAKTPVTAD